MTTSRVPVHQDSDFNVPLPTFLLNDDQMLGNAIDDLLDALAYTNQNDDDEEESFKEETSEEVELRIVLRDEWINLKDDQTVNIGFATIKVIWSRSSVAL